MNETKGNKVTYYPQPRPGSGFTFFNRRTGRTIECASVEWYLDFRSPGGKRQRRKAHAGVCICEVQGDAICPHERRAQEFATQLQGSTTSFNGKEPQQVLEGFGSVISIASRVKEYIDYVEQSEQHSKTYTTSIRATLKHFVKWAAAHNMHYVSEVSTRAAAAYSLYVQSENIAGRGQPKRLRKHNTVNRYLREVRALFYLMVDDEILRENPFRERRHSRKIFLRVTDARPTTIFTDEELHTLLSLTIDDFRKIVNNYAETLHDMIRLFYTTGMRLGEVCNLTFAQVRQLKIHIEPHHKWKPKWGIRRTIPLHVETRELLEQRRAALPDSEYVFVTSNDTPYDEHNVYHAFVRLFNHLGIVGDTYDGVSPHSFRRTFCTHCLASGVSAAIVKDWMGHSKIEMTMKYYAKIPSKTDQFINQVNFVSPRAHTPA